MGPNAQRTLHQVRVSIPYSQDGGCGKAVRVFRLSRIRHMAPPHSMRLSLKCFSHSLVMLTVTVSEAYSKCIHLILLAIIKLV